MNLTQARLSVSERLLYLAFVLILLVVAGVIALFFLLKSQAAQQATDLSNQVDKLLRYEECVAKIDITPIGEPKAIVGDVNDPGTALENCRIVADGEPVSSNEGVSPTDQPDFNPSEDQLAAQPGTSNTIPQASQTPEQQDNPSSPEPTIVIQQIIDDTLRTVDDKIGGIL